MHMILIKRDYALCGLNGTHKPLSHFSYMFFTHVLAREITILEPCLAMPSTALLLENP